MEVSKTAAPGFDSLVPRSPSGPLMSGHCGPIWGDCGGNPGDPGRERCVAA
jgi:hypothetical protein